MTITQDMDAEFVALRPVPAGTVWLVGGNVWPALIADLVRVHREHGAPFDPRNPPRELFGVPVRHVRRMSGWGLAQPLDPEAELAHESTQGVDAHAAR